MLRLVFAVALLCVQQAESFSIGFGGHLDVTSKYKGTSQLTAGQGHFSNAVTGSAASLRMSSDSTSAPTTLSSGSASKGKLLVLGASGFAGSKIAEVAVENGYEVVGLSRRGRAPPGSKLETMPNVVWKSGDATKYEEIEAVLAEDDFHGVIHAIGILFEGEQNKFASGSGSVPSAGMTYDDITRKTAFNAIKAFTEKHPAEEGKPKPPFAFISAAEARWDFDQYFEGTPAEFLRRYLVAKRAVEEELEAKTRDGSLRRIIVRPSLIWTWDNPGALLPVAAFTVANKLGVPIIDQPVSVARLARAVVAAVAAGSEEGVFDYRDMRRLDKALPP